MFEIELEFAVADGKQKRSPNADECIPEESLEGRHFLLVEDNAINSEILAELFRCGEQPVFEGEWAAGSRGV